MEQSANDPGTTPVPQAVAGHPHPAHQYRAPQVLPANLKSGQDRARSTKILMYGLAGLAVALIAVGVAAPQLTYASDAHEYASLMDDAADAAARTASREAELAAADLLLAKQYEEAAGIAARLSQLAAVGPDVLAPDASEAFASAAANVLAEIPNTQPPVSPRALATLEATIGADPALRPASWFAAEAHAMGELAEIRPEAPQVAGDNGTVSRAALDDARRQLKLQRADVDALSAEVSGRSEETAQLRGTVAAGYTTVLEVAAAVPESSEALIAKLPETSELRDRIRDAAAQVPAALGSGDTMGDDAAVIAQGAAGVAALEAYVTVATEVWAEHEKRVAEAAARPAPAPMPQPMPPAPTEEIPPAPEPPVDPEPQPETPAPPTPSEEPPIDLAGDGA